MADYKFDYIQPDDVTSEVPGEQEIRGTNHDTAQDDANAISTLQHGDKGENRENYVLTPVVTITTNEATFTKGDMKLQSISVTENVSTAEDVSTLTHHSPIHSSAPSEQPIRMEERRTRIPTRFKQAVERARRDKSLPNMSDGEMTLPAQPRRSSIPRLRAKRPPSPKPEIDDFDQLYDDIAGSSIDIDVSLLNNKVEDPGKVEDRFEEIIHDYDEGRIKPITLEEVVGKKYVETPESVNVGHRNVDKAGGILKHTVWNTKDTGNTGVEATDAKSTEKPKSRIPMLTRRSETEIEAPKTIQKVVQSKPFSDRIKVQNAIDRFPKDDNVNVRKLPSRKAVTKTSGIDNDQLNDTNQQSVKDFKDGEKYEIQYENVEIYGSYESDLAPDNIVKVDDVFEKPHASIRLLNTVEIVDLTPAVETTNDYLETLIEPYTVEIVDEIVKNPTIETYNLLDDYEETETGPSSIEFIEAPATAPILSNTNQMFFEEETVQKPTKTFILNEPEEIKPIESKTELKLSPVEVISIAQNPQTVKADKEDTIQSEVLPVNTFRRIENDQIMIDDTIKNVNTEEVMLPVQTITPTRILDVDYDKTNLTKDPQIRKLKEDAIASEVLPINTMRNIENDTKDYTYIRNSQIEEEVSPVQMISEEFAPESLDVDFDEVNNNSIDYSIHYEPYIEAETDKIEEITVKNSSDDETPVLRGKVSRMINRLHSGEDKDEPKKEAIDDIPKPKSVLSKIAMFEHQEPAAKPKPGEIKTKPIEDPTDFKPKIINEVLKPLPRSINPKDDQNKDHTPFERTNSVTEVNVKGTAVTTVIKADEAVTEDIHVVNENKPFDDYNTASIEYQNFEDEMPEPVQGDLNVKPIELEYVDVATTEFQPKSIEDKNEDAVFINHVNKTAQFDTARKREVIESPFDFIPNSSSHKIRNYDEYKSTETPSLDYSVNKPSRYNRVSKFDTVKSREDESPFDFKPKEPRQIGQYFDDKYATEKTAEVKDAPFDFKSKYHSQRSQNYEEDKQKDYKAKNYDTDVRSKNYRGKTQDNNEDYNETPSLDYGVNRPGRFRSRNEEKSYNLRKAKSVAELDLGDAVKGRVHEMIVRMKSVDRSAEKREVISAKERPRKKSVSEKIALFEGKLSVHTTHQSQSRSLKPAKKVTEDAMSPSELQTRVAELTSAKLTWGRVTNMSYLVLANGKEMPVLSIGTALLDKQLTPHVVSAAIDLGYRAIDAAWVYGNEREVGEGIRAKIEDGTVKREDLFIVNKLWSTFHRQDLALDACRRSLDAMRLDYFDLYLVHNPMSFKEGLDPIPKIANVIQYSKHDYLDAWYGMENLVVKGLVRSIGVSNFNSAQIQRVVEKARVKPTINMVESHPYLSQQRLDDFCSERNIKLFTYGVLGSKGTPSEIKGSTEAAIDDPLIKVMAAGLGVTPAQLLVRYQIECGHAVVTKSSSGAHLWDNLQALSFSLTEGQVDAIRALNRNKRAFTFKGMGDTHKNYPFNIAF